MRSTCLTAIAVVLVACVSGCTNSGISSTASYNPGYGPFDKNGNYVEAWADKPAKKHWWSRQPAATPKPTPTKKPPVLASTTPRTSQRTSAAASRPVASRPPDPRPVSRPPVIAAATNTNRPPAAAPPRPKPKPKPTPVAKPKPKPQPMVRHSVAKGDTLYSLSRRYGTSVSAIQRANGLSGTNIRIGQSLKIPK